MKKKFLLMMMLSLLFTAMGTSVLNAQSVAKVGNTEYTTIDEAIANWTNGTTLTLLADVTLSDVIQLSSTEYHILNLGTYTMTAASKKDAIQIVNNGRSSASFALDITADATNPGGITASGKTIVVTTGKSGVKDRPIIRFYNGVFNGSNVVKHSGSNGTNCPQFWFYGGVFNGNINTNRSLNQFYGGTFSGQLWMSVDSSAYTLVAGGTFKNLSNLYGSALNSGKFTIGSAKGVYDREVYIDNNGDYVIATAEPAQGFEADVAKKNLDTDDYLAYSKVATDGQLGYTNVYTALKKNTTGTVTVYVEELDMSEVTNFKGTIVVPADHTITITNAPATLVVMDEDDNVLEPNANGTYTTVEPAGNNFTGYTGEDGIWGEVWGNATTSFVIKVLDANGNVMGTTSLNNVDGIIDGDVNVTWNLKLDAASNTDEYWTMSWTTTTVPTIDNMPAKVELWVDGVKVSGGNVVLNGPDEINKIYAAVTDADGKIYSYHMTIQDAIDAITGTRSVTPNVIALLRDTNEEVTLPAGITLNLNEHDAPNVSVPVAQIGDQTYTSLQAAINAVQDGETITLIDNVTVSVATAAYNDGTYIDGVRYTGDKSFTVDFNGKTVTDDGCVNDYLIYINNKGEKASEITFTNGTIVSKDGCWSAVCVNSSAATQNVVLNLNGMNITNSNDADYSGNPVVRARNLATVNVNDGTIITSNGASYGVAANTDGSTININEGATIVQQNSGETGGNSVFAAVGGKGVINIKGGTITSDKFGVHTMTTGTPVINISGGTITAPVALKSSTNGGNGELATINVTGGTINGTLETNTENGKIVVSGGTFSEAVAQEYCAEGYVPVENADGTFGVEKAPVAKVGENTYRTFAEAAAAAQAGDEIKLLANIEGDITVPANVTLNGNGFAISGGIFAEGDITFAGVTTAADFDAKVANTAVNIPAGASLQLTGSARLVIGHGATFNITGTIEDAKTADKATLVPSLKIAAGASITGNGVTFNVNNAYIVAEKYCSSKNSNANGTFNFNINNSIWDQTGSLQFSAPTNSMDPTVNFNLANSVLTTTSHVIFSVTKGEVVIDNSKVNEGVYRQLENRSTMTVKNGSVVNGTVATSENAKNPGTIIVENATYAVTGEFSGSDLGTGTLIVNKTANFSAGSITKANIQIDATGMNAGYEVNIAAKLNNLAGTIEVINNNMLDAKIVDGKIVIVERTLQGEGTEASPYLINDVDDLVWLQEKVDELAQDGSTQFAGKYFKLTNDIDLNGINWNPIGTMSADHGSFKGVFDGGDHTISNLYVEQAGNGIGLFARTTGNAVIKNLKLNNVTVKSTDNSNYVGGLVGNAYASTKIENVHVSGNVYISGRGYIGGIAGHGYVVMDNVSVVATGDGHGNTKGLITSTFWCAGGVLGYAGEGATNIMNAQVENVVVTSAAGGLGAIVGMAKDNNGTQPISGSNLSAENVEIKTYIGAYGDSYANHALGYLYGGNPTSILTGDLSVEEVTIETSTGEIPEVNDAVAQIGNSIYFNLQDVLNAGGNVTVLRDIALAEGLTVAADKTVVLDLNGKTISRNTEAATSTAAITNNGNLTIKDSSDPSTGKITAFAANPDTQAVPYYASNTITNCGVLTVLGGTIENSTGDEARAAYPIDNNSTSRDAIVTIEGGKVTGRGAIRQFANSTTHKNEVNVKGGEVFGSSYAIWVQNPNSNDNKAALNIEGGKLSKILISPSAEFDVAITGGELTEVAIWNADETNPERNPSNFISGGTFTQNMEEFCVEGYKMELNENGTYGVVPFETKEYVINANGEIKTLADAIAKAKEDGTDIVTYTIYGAATLETGYSHGIVDFGGREGYITIQGGSDNTRSTDSFTITGGGVPDIKGVTFKDLTFYDEGEYLPTANEFMYQNFIDCTFENVTFEDGIRLSGNSVVRNCTFNANTNDEYAIWLDKGTFEMTGSTVTAGNEAYGLLKSDVVEKITISDNTFQYLAKVNKEALNVNGAIIVAEDNTFIDCAKGVVPTEKTNYTEDGTIPITNEIIAQNNTVVVYVAKINDTKYESLAAAATAAQDGETIQLLWAEGHAPISMNASLYGNKNVTITGNATVDWSKGWLFVGRGGAGDATLIFDNAILTSNEVSLANGTYGIHVSAKEGNDVNKNYGKVIFKNSDVQLSYLANRNNVEVDGGKLYVHYGFWVGGRPSTEIPDGSEGTATMDIKNGAVVEVNNHNGMGIGHEGNGVMNITSSTFKYTGTSFNLAKEENSSINVYGESTIEITTLEGGSSIDLMDGAIVKNSTVGGDAYIAGNVIFRGDNTFAMISDYGDYYSQETPSMWTVEAGASLTLTKTDRYGLGYGDKVTVYGEIEDEKALTARASLTDEDASVNMYGGLVGMTNSAAPNAENSFTATNAYLIFGVNGDKSFGNKPGNYYGNYTFTFNNSVVTANGFKFYEDNGTSTVKFSDSDLLVNGVLMTNDASSNFTFENSVVLSMATINGTDDKNQNAGVMTLTNTQFTYSAAFTNVGTLNIGESSTFTAPSVVNTGTINFTALSAKLDTDTEGLTIVDKVNNADYKVVYQDGTYQFVPKDYVAQIGEDKYESLQEAFDAAQHSDEIVVLKDIVLTEGITVAADDNMTLDLNGKTISMQDASGKAAYAIKNNGSLTIKDSAEGGKITFNSTTPDNSFGYATSTIGNGGHLTIENGLIENTTVGGASYAVDGIWHTGEASLTINDGTITATQIAVRQVPFSATAKNTVTINGGTFTGATAGLQMFNINDDAKLSETIIKGGTFNGTYGFYTSFTSAQASELATINIDGGTFNGDVYLYNGKNGSNEYPMTVAITDGLFNSGAYIYTKDTNGNEVPIKAITGGTFSVDPTDYCAPDYSPIFNDSTNTYTVIKTSGTFTRTLSSGWSWFSYYIDIEGSNGLDALKEDMGAACEQFKSQTAFTFYSNNKWYTGPNALTGTNVEDMYMVKMRESKEISLSGKLAVPEEEKITLKANGWTWIGYPLENSINVSDALATFNSIEGDYIKSKTLYAEYVKLSNGTYAWKGSLNSMIPGEGYKYKSVSGNEKVVYYSSASNRTAVKANVTSENNYWVASNSKYSSNMTVVAMMSIDNEIVNDSYEIAAFANGECRGSARAIYDEDLNAYMLYLTIHGEDVENITFKYYDVNYGTEYELGNVVVYSSDAILGSINNPYMFNLDILNVDEASINEVNVYPNPTTTNAEIDLNATCDKVEVFNALGVKVAEYSNVDSIDTLETAGVYVIRVTIDGNVRNCRLVVK